jgi:hypothetical protein
MEKDAVSRTCQRHLAEYTHTRRTNSCLLCTLLMCLYWFAWDSSVSLATWCGLHGESPVSGREEIVVLVIAPRRAVGPRVHYLPSALLGNECLGLIRRGVRRPECEVDHSLPSSAEINDPWSLGPLPRVSLWRGASAQGQLRFYPYWFAQMKRGIATGVIWIMLQYVCYHSSQHA